MDALIFVRAIIDIDYDLPPYYVKLPILNLITNPGD